MKKTILITALCLAAFALVSCGGGNGSSNSSDNNASGSENGHEYVDLGLPSGTLWATCNVGADTPEGCGVYYAWGETGIKGKFTGDNYKHGFLDWDYVNLTKYNTSLLGWDNVNLTKYNTNSEYGTVDNRTTLELSDDVAHVMWGGDWRMPTAEEMEELCDRCQWTWTQQNEVNGYQVMGPNGNTIFLPAGGLRYESGLDCVGSYGFYWSSSLHTDGPFRARLLVIVSGSLGVNFISREHGLTVRPVRR